MPRSECTHGSNAYKQVRCDRCGRNYICTPGDDFYCAAEGDHCCEACLLSGAAVTELITEMDGFDGPHTLTLVRSESPAVKP
jgi:hypothetical protein